MTKIQGFDWDQGNIGKVQKHETRFFAFDRFGAKILFVVFTIRAIDGWQNLKRRSQTLILLRDMSFLIKEKGKWVRLNELFQLQKKNKTITLRVSDDLLNEVKKIAKDDDIDYQKLIRNILIEYVSKLVVIPDFKFLNHQKLHLVVV